MLKVAVLAHSAVLKVNRRAYAELARRGLEVEIIAPRNIPYKGVELAAQPRCPDEPVVHNIELRGGGPRSHRWMGVTKLLTYIAPDVVILEADPASWPSLEVSKWCAAQKVPLICRTCENLPWWPAGSLPRVGVRGLPASLAKVAMNRWVMRRIHAVCVTSEYAAGLFRRAGYARVFNIPLGTDPARFRYSKAVRQSVREEYSVPDGIPVIAYYGRTVPEKGVDTLVQALGLIKDLPWILFINRFEERSAYMGGLDKLIAMLGIGDRVKWIEARHGEISRLMMASDVAVLPSRSTSKWVEQYGRVVPEAAACGNLLVVSDSGAPKELVKGFGLVFSEGDAGELAASLRAALSMPRQERLARKRAGMRHVRRNLSVTAEAKALHDLVNSCAGETCAF